MNSISKQRKRSGWLIFVAMAGLVACGKKQPTAVKSQSQKPYSFAEGVRNDPGLSEAEKAILLAQVPRDEVFEKQRPLDRQELVMPAPPGWKPEDAPRKLKIMLIPEKTMIRANEKFRYRMEIQNVGRESIFFSGGFIKMGNLGGTDPVFTFYVTPPGEQERKMLFPSFGDPEYPHNETFEIPFPESMSDEQRAKEAKLFQWRMAAKSSIELSLQPGETLLTRPNPPPPNRFRDLKTGFKFRKPGTYRIRVDYDDLGDHPDVKDEKFLERSARASHVSREQILKWHEEFRKKRGVSPEQEKKEREDDIRRYEKRKLEAVGRTTSNTVSLEVMP